MASQTYKNCLNRILTLVKSINKAAKSYPDKDGNIGRNGYLYSKKHKLIVDTVKEIVSTKTKSIAINIELNSDIEDKSLITFYFKKDKKKQSFHINKNLYEKLFKYINGERYEWEDE